MSTITTVHLIDDIDGTSADQTVAFAIDGSAYEIDLSDGNATKLREALAEYVGAARVAKPAPVRRAASTGGATAEARAWLRANGHEVKDKGRIPADLLAAYEARNQHTAPEVTAEPAPVEEPAEATQGALPIAEDPVEATDADILHWWNVVKGYKHSDKVNGLIRNGYLRAHPAVA